MLRDHIKNENEEKTFEMTYKRWLALLPHMTVNTTMGKKPPLKFIPFEKYYKKITTPQSSSNLSKKSVKEIIQEVSKVIEYNRSQ